MFRREWNGSVATKTIAPVSAPLFFKPVDCLSGVLIVKLDDPQGFERPNYAASIAPFGGPTALLQKVLDTIPQNVFWKDLNSVYLGCNHHFAKLAGMKSPDDIVGKTDFDLPWDRDEAAFYRECDQRVMDSGVAELGIIESQYTNGGEKIWIETNKAPLHDGDGNVIGILGTYHDISKIKQAEESLRLNNEQLEQRVAERTQELQRASKQIHLQLIEKDNTLDRLKKLQQQLVETSRAAGMAEVATSVLHDIGNVMNSVNVSAAQIRKYYERSAFSNLEKVSGLISEHEDDFSGFVATDSRGQKIPPYIARVTEALRTERKGIDEEFQSILGNIAYINKIVSAQSDLARAPGVIQEVTVESLISEAVASCSECFRENQVELVIDLHEDLPPISSEKHKVTQILAHVLRNGFEASSKGVGNCPKIEIAGRLNNDFVEIEVKDFGAGISDSQLGKIFAHGFTTRRKKNGFGLHNAANMAIELGGSLVAFSDGVGCGATFCLSLPIVKELPNNAD